MNETITTISDAFKVVSNNVVVSFVILFFGLVIGKIIEKSLQFVFNYFEIDKQIFKFLGIKLHVKEIIPTLIAYVVYIITIVMSLTQLGISIKVISIFFLIIIILMIISVIISLFEAIPNIIYGVSMLRNSNFSVGDKITIENYSGIVKEINLTSIALEKKSGELIILPSSFLRKKVIRKNVTSERTIKKTIRKTTEK